MGARRELTAAVVERYRSARRADKGRILDELCAVTGWHRTHAVRALAGHVAISPEARRQRRPTDGAPIRDALVALWEASDRICGKRLKVMIPTLLPSLER
ncbi:transposase, partial [Bradyrhizobium sp. Arg237L]|nr:transposase [Bradyrhizobium sp. Arg237L]